METLDYDNACHSQPGELPAGAWPPGELDELGDEDLLHIIRSQPAASAPRTSACEVLVARYRGLVRACANRYRGSPEPTEDLVQVGYLGLMRAINNFDPDIGHSLGAYAQPCITGEIKRYFRDKRWHAHIERPVQELLLQVRSASLGAWPSCWDRWCEADRACSSSSCTGRSICACQRLSRK